MVNYKSFENLSEDIKRKLHKIHAGKYDLIVGIPRSGIIPAYMIGLYANLNVIDFEGFVENRRLKKGITRQVKLAHDRAHDAQNVLLVDDSISSGKSMVNVLAQLPDNLRKRVTTMAVYSDRKRRNDVDFYLECVPTPRVFEWNIFHHNLLSKACVDIDGVLCLDPTENENDDGEKYIKFLLNSKPHIIPSNKVHSLVTSRLEKYRPQTEEWLERNGVQYDHLIMLDLPSKSERQRLGAHSIHKANYYKSNRDLDIFIESDVRQARDIMEKTSKSVYCVDSNSMLSPGVWGSVLSAPNNFRKTFKSRLAKNLPYPLFRLLRLIYKNIFKS
jgi:uncharacterized HAD superfamily protein/orotate phosphoribosyltransferase